MPKLILRCNYLKNSPPAHLANYINYIGTREGVEKVASTTSSLPATDRQKSLIEDILAKIPDANRMHEYHDYIQRPTRENASEFITQALENNLDIIAKKKNYMDYLANRPGVEIIGTHGLFSNEGEPVVLSCVAEEVANHPGVIWTNVISLRREDAERLGYDSAAQWQALLRSRVQLLCENYKIDSRNLKWYAAFHNESHHPQIAQQMQLLSRRLKNTGGKKVYGYLKADVKAIVNDIVDELAKEERVAECYQAWLKSREEIQHYYKDSEIERIPLSQQKELKSIKNMVIREAVRFGEGYLYLEEAETGIERLEEISEQQTESLAALQGEDMPDILPEQTEMEEQESDRQEEGQGESISYFARWTDRYKEAREYLYGTMEAEPDEEAAHESMLEEAEQGNAYAMHDMGKIYAQGIGCEADKEKADVWYQKALAAMHYVEQKKSNTYLEYRIGKMYQYGLGTDENMEQAGEWFSKAAAKEHKYALYSLGMLYLQGKGVEQNEETAYSLLFRSYSKENPYAAYELGKLYETGCGTEKNQEKSENCYRAAFLGFLNLEKKSKDDTLWYRIGCMYLHGIGTEADETKAEHYLTKASDYGNTHASYQLARLYIRQESQKLSGESGTAPDYAKIAKAVKWLEESAAQENPFADYALGRLYREGTLVAADMEKAVFHLKRAADAGNSYAQYQLGKIYLEEDNKNIPAAIQYLTLAAKQKNEFAAYRLGNLYLAGEELPKNTELALHYLKMAADTGNQYAQYTLGKVYLIGKDVQQDKELAYDYFLKSAEQGNIYAAYFLEHWNDMPHPDLLLMATRLMRHLEHIIEENVAGRKSGDHRQGIDRKLARKIRQKKIAQGHAVDDHEDMVQTQ